MRIRLFVFAVALVLSAPGAHAGERPLPNARLEFSGWIGGVGIGYESLDGTLFLDGETYPVTIVGMTAIEVGLVYVSGSARVWGLHDRHAIQGRYRAFTVSATLGGGGHATWLQNRADVYLEMTSHTYGLGLSGGPSSIRIFLHGAEKR